MPISSFMFQLIHEPSDVTVACVTRLDGWWAKGLGVIGMRSLPADKGVWLPGVSAVHTAFVAFPLDLLFLDAQFRTLRVRTRVLPWRPLIRAPGAYHTIELAAGTLAGLAVPVSPGDLWLFRPLSEQDEWNT